MLKIKYSLCVCVLLFFLTAKANSNKDSIFLLKVGKIFDESKGKYDSTSYKNFHFVLQEAKKYNKVNMELEAYKSLLWYHGKGHKKSRLLDSVLMYANIFESKILKLDKQKYAETIAGHYLNKGYVLANSFGLPEIGLKSYYKSYEYIGDDIKIKSVYNAYISQIFKLNKEYDKAIEVLKQSLKDTASLKVPFKLMFLQNLASCYQAGFKNGKSRIINENILEIAKKNNNDYYLWWAKNELSFDYYKLSDIERAIDTALVVRAYYKKNLNIDALLNNSYYLGRFYKDKGNYNKAIKFAKESIKDKYSINGLTRSYDLIASIYLEKKDYNKAKYYYQKKEEVRDSLRKREYSLYSSYMNANSKLNEQTDKNKEITYTNKLLEEENKKKSLYIILLLTAFLVFLLLILILYLYKNKKKKDKEVEVLKANEKKLLEEQIELKNNELEATVSFLSKRVAILNKLKEHLEEEKKTDEEKVKNTSVIISKLIENSSDIEMLTNKVSSRYSSLSITLKKIHPDLSPREIDYCLLTKLNLSIKETAAILNVAPGTVKVTRSKLKNRMKIPAEVSFRNYLESISEKNN